MWVPMLCFCIDSREFVTSVLGEHTLFNALNSYLLEIEVSKLRYRIFRENFDIEVLNFDIEVLVYVADIQAALGFPTATGMHVDASHWEHYTVFTFFLRFYSLTFSFVFQCLSI